MTWTEGIYRKAFSQMIDSDKFALRDHDYVFEDRKVGGNAQSISGKRWLHHTSLLWDFDPARMAMLQMPKKRPEYRADRPHGDFIRSLSAAGVAGKKPLLDAIVHAAEAHFELREGGAREADGALAAPHRKTTRALNAEGL